MKPFIKRVFFLYTVMFCVLIGYLFKVSLWDSKNFISNSYNPRINSSLDYIKRGSILDINEEPIAESVLQEDGTYKRVYNYGSAFAHITGYSARGKTGVESKYNYLLERISNELFQNLGNIFADEEIKGDDIVLTVDANLQNYVAEQLGNSRGAVVAIEPDSGKVLSLVSYPSFDPNTINEDWDYINSDEANSPLLSRATQGLYPPGSVFKIVTAAAALDYSPTYEDFEMYCEGEKYFGGKTLHCFNSTAHGNVDMITAFAESCNTYFATIGTEIGARNIVKTANDFMFNSDLGFDLEYSTPTFSMTDDAEVSEIVETAIGQGKTLVSPLFMAMVAAAVGNNGMMMKPYIFDHSINNWGISANKTIPEKLGQVIEPEIADEIKEFMKEVVNSGTGTDAGFYVTKTNDDEDVYDRSVSDSAVSDSTISSSAASSSSSYYVQVAGKTGTAENSLGDDHAWFVAFAPADDPKIAVAVVLENAGKGSRAVPIARNTMKYYMENCME